jgi:hypothetical protein
MRDIVEGVIRTLRAEWTADVWDPKSDWVIRANHGEDAPDTRRWAARIECYFAAAGPSWRNRLNARPGRIKYRPFDDAWCGMFVNYGLANPEGVNARLHPKLSELVLPSTYRLNTAAYWTRAGFKRPRSLPASAVQRGDVLTVTTRKTNPKAYGDHIVLALGPADANGDIPTIEGNASGNKPTGPWDRQGVVIRTRPVDSVKRVYRFGPEHFTER